MRYFDERLGAWVTVCQPGAALGSDDLRNWSGRRATGLSGSDSYLDHKREKAFKAGKKNFRNPRLSKRMRGKVARGEA